MNYLVVIFILLSCVGLNCCSHENIIIEHANVVVIDSIFDDISSNKFIHDISHITHNNIIIFLDTPGGSIVAGHKMIQYMDSLSYSGKNITCIAENAASMGFAFFQACPLRLVMPHSIIMQHQPSFGYAGQEKRINSRLKLTRTIIKKQNKRQCIRLKLTKFEFDNKISDDWWMYGSDIIRNNAADKIIQLTCHPDIIDDNLCPLIKKIKLIQ